MARPIYSHELADPDFHWLVSTYKENNPVSFTVEGSCLPVVMVTGLPAQPESSEVKPEEHPAVPVPETLPRALKDEPEYS